MPERNYLDLVMESAAGVLSRPGNLEDTLIRISRAACDTVPGADFAGITILHPDDTLETLGPTGIVVTAVDQLQYSLKEGSCYDPAASQIVAYSADLGADEHWPSYGPKAAALGLHSQLSVRLGQIDGKIANLNLYSQTRSAFEETGSIAQLFASHARVALGYAKELGSLGAALTTRTIIGQATGIIMERYSLTDDSAFQYLIRSSQNNNIKLRDLAADLVNGINGEAL